MRDGLVSAAPHAQRISPSTGPTVFLSMSWPVHGITFNVMGSIVNLMKVRNSIGGTDKLLVDSSIGFASKLHRRVFKFTPCSSFRLYMRHSRTQRLGMSSVLSRHSSHPPKSRGCRSEEELTDLYCYSGSSRYPVRVCCSTEQAWMLRRMGLPGRLAGQLTTLS